ncbi:Glycosyl transferase, family 31 [Cynara cardunculus var. scolymus]|uniref:Hexosyltransferase n=1 Tax=Cynara cardunculus var. scolymus TaxID=59895 RepID=A0A103XJP4_CYNCS|nr:Glycosyl transferase, family 31 [Cynara cardunculus var. scolymus]
MRSRGSNNRLSSSRSAFRWRISSLVLSMFATMAAFFVACRLWQEAESRVYLVKELDRRTGQVMELEEAKKEGYVSKHLIETKGTNEKKKLLAVVGILTGFGRKHNRYAIRKAWMPTGTALTKLEDEKGIIIRFVIGRSLNHGDNSDRDINNENIKEKDFLILNDHVETAEEKPKKTKLFFIDALEHWDAEFYVKVNDDIYLNIDALGAILSNHVDKPRAYIGCMKSGGVFSKPTDKWYEPEWWKFGDRKSYFRHASGEIFAVSQALAQFISINKLILRSYAHDDVSVGSWLIGLDVKHVDEGKFCCSSWSSGALCAAS